MTMTASARRFLSAVKGRQRGKEGDELVEEGEPPIGKKQDQEQVGKDSHRTASRGKGGCAAASPGLRFFPLVQFIMAAGIGQDYFPVGHEDRQGDAVQKPP